MNSADKIKKLQNIIKRQAKMIEGYRIAMAKIEEIIHETQGVLCITDEIVCLICGSRVSPYFSGHFERWYCPLCDTEILC